MAILLKVRPEVLEQTSQNIDKQIQEVKKLLQEMETDIKNTQGYWEGEASDKHQSEFASAKEGIEAALNSIKRNPEKLLQMAGLYKESEAELVAATQSLNDNIIS